MYIHLHAWDPPPLYYYFRLPGFYWEGLLWLQLHRTLHGYIGLSWRGHRKHALLRNPNWGQGLFPSYSRIRWLWLLAQGGAWKSPASSKGQPPGVRMGLEILMPGRVRMAGSQTLHFLCLATAGRWHSQTSTCPITIPECSAKVSCPVWLHQCLSVWWAGRGPGLWEAHMRALVCVLLRASLPNPHA